MIDQIYSKFRTCSGITTDSRQVPNQSMFIALSGPSFDGNQFAKQALEQGAKYAVVDDQTAVLDDRYILVENGLQTLQQLASHHRDQMRFPVIAITGSNGKTTTKELIAAVLHTQKNIHFTQGNFNNHIGLPLTILRAPLNLDFLILEMGANHIGEIAALCEIGKPTYGMITNIGDAHLEGFGSHEGVIIGKTELFKYLKKHKGTIFINESDQLLMEEAVGLNKEKYAHLYKSMHSHPNLEVKLQDDSIIHTQLIGDYNLYNILAALSIGLHFGIPQDVAIKAIELYSPSNNRSELQEHFGAKVILDAYNANSSSMLAASDSFSRLTGRKLAILGDMMELGEESVDHHQSMSEKAISSNVDQIILIGEIFKRSAKPHNHIIFVENANAAKNWLTQHENTFDWILIKGSRKMQLEKIVED